MRWPTLISIAALIMVLLCSLVILSIAGRLSHTWDEPHHIVTGLEWLQDGTSTMWTENPPIARVAVALGPYLRGARLPESGRSAFTLQNEGLSATTILGNNVLYGDGDYAGQLQSARLGTLFFFLVAAGSLWFWASAQSRIAGVIGVAAFCTLPSILAHSALATTDIALVSVVALFLWQFVRWLDAPTIPRTLLVGLTLGLCVATKFSSLLFIPVTGLAFVGTRLWVDWRAARFQWADWGTRLIRLLLIAVPLAALVLWAVYGFSVGQINDLPPRLHPYMVYGSAVTGLRGDLGRALLDVTLPMPEFFHGLLFLLAHNDAGHATYALGEASQTGFWFFYPLTLLVKTPLPFILFVLAGIVAAVRGRQQQPWWVGGAWIASLLIILSLLPSNINLGVRHILIVYALVTIGAATAIATLLPTVSHQRTRRVLIGFLSLLFIWQLAGNAAIYPNQIAFFNPLAGSDPAAVLVESDLDWGQGVYALETYFADKDVETLYIALNGSSWLCEHDLPPLEPLTPGQQTGWIAISELIYRTNPDYYRAEIPCDADSMWEWRGAPSTWLRWLDDHEPVAIVGPVRVYHIEA